MSYPPPRYHGTAGEVSATFRRAHAIPQLARSDGGAAHYLATTATTEGKFGLYRWDMGPGVSGPDPHFHRTLSESFFVLSGVVRLYDGAGWLSAHPGDFLYVPEGGIHGFKNESGEPASMLLLFAPGASREDYFETLADTAQWAEMTDEERTDFYLRHDNHWL